MPEGRVLVTGANRGIGAAIASQLAAAGLGVAGLTRTGTSLRLRSAVRSRRSTSSAPTCCARVRPCWAEMGRPVGVRAKAASANEPSRAARKTTRRRARGE